MHMGLISLQINHFFFKRDCIYKIDVVLENRVSGIYLHLL